MQMNGGKAGCQWPQTILASKLRSTSKIRCNTHYKKNSKASLHIEVRQLSGTNVSRVYRLWMNYSKLVKYKVGGWLPVHNAGIYGVTGPNMNRMGPMCRHFQYGPFGGGPDCSAFERYFKVPLNGSIPQNWSRKYGNVHFLLLNPFAVKRVISRDVLGSWGVDSRAYPAGIKPGTFPTNFAQLMHLVSTRHPSRRTRVNCNTALGIPDHVDYADIHDAKATIITRPGVINVPKIGKIALKSGMRIELRATRKKFAITILKPVIGELKVPLGKTSATARNITVGAIRVVMPSIPDLRFGKKTMSDTKVEVTGLSIPSLKIGNIAFGKTSSVSGAKLKLSNGKLVMKKVNGKFTSSLTGHFDINIGRVAARDIPMASGLLLSGALKNVRVSGPARITFNSDLWDVRGGAQAGFPGTKLKLTAKLKGGRIRHLPTGKGYGTDLHVSDELIIKDIKRISYRLAQPGRKKGSLFNLALAGFAIRDITISGYMGIATLGRIIFSKLTGNLRVASANIAMNGTLRQSVLQGINLDVREGKGRRKRCKVAIPRAAFTSNKVKISDHGGKRFSIDCLINTPHGFTHLKTGNR